MNILATISDWVTRHPFPGWLCICGAIILFGYLVWFLFKMIFKWEYKLAVLERHVKTWGVSEKHRWELWNRIGGIPLNELNEENTIVFHRIYKTYCKRFGEIML